MVKVIVAHPILLEQEPDEAQVPREELSELGSCCSGMNGLVGATRKGKLPAFQIPSQRSLDVPGNGGIYPLARKGTLAIS